ncbi:MAG: hypothetical protein E6Q78_02580 [Rhodoferax sp.]|nr:MAG: hypothetical protein E6Q78_02580 [Rhodoferax sp.]
MPSAASQPTSLHLPSLLVAMAIMLVGSIYPMLFSDAQGHADHTLAMALFWAMSAGLVRGVGFIPRAPVWKMLFSGWSCALALTIAVLWRWSY